VTLAFVVALQHLPARQRAVLLLREVVGYEASEVAAMLRMTLPAVNSALGRARARLASTRRLSAELGATSLDAGRQRLLRLYVKAWESGDVGALVALLSRDASFSMPPTPTWFHGRRGISSALAGHVFARGRRFRLLPTRANGQLAFGVYKAEHGESKYRFHGIQVVSLGRGYVRSAVTFQIPRMAKAFDLATELPIRRGRK
jgi:RNA polymerase sigma-70 factor, ECF subfamily